MNTKSKESTTKEIPLLVRSEQWKITEKTENQIFAVCLKNNQDDITMQLNQKIVQQSQKIDSQNKLINQQSQMIDHQNKKIDDLNDLLHLQNDINTELRSRIEILERIEQNKDKGKTVSRQAIPNETVKSPSSNSRTAILMADSNSDPNATVFGSRIKRSLFLGTSIKRSDISAIYTKNTLKHVPAFAYDVSAANDGSVMAWPEKSNDGKTHILYLAADGDIYANPDSSYLFANYTKLNNADLSHLKTDLVTNMKNIFGGCVNLKQLDVSNWDVSNVTDMSFMFFQCEQLASIDVFNWNVSNVTNMSGMFNHCKQLASIDVSNWNVSNVTDMSFMFNKCELLASIDISHWKISKTTNITNMFDGCRCLDLQNH